LQELGQTLGGIPCFEGTRVVGVLSCIEEPDAAFLSNLTQGHWFSLMGTFLPFAIITYAI